MPLKHLYDYDDQAPRGLWSYKNPSLPRFNHSTCICWKYFPEGHKQHHQKKD